MLEEKSIRFTFVRLNDNPEIGLVDNNDENFKAIWFNGHAYPLGKEDELYRIGSGILQGEQEKLSIASRFIQEYRTVSQTDIYIMNEKTDLSYLSFVELNKHVLMGYMPVSPTVAKEGTARVHYFKNNGKIGKKNVYVRMSEMYVDNTGIVWEGATVEQEEERVVQYFQPKVQKNQLLYYSNELTMKVDRVRVHDFDMTNGTVILYTIVDDKPVYFPFETRLAKVHKERWEAKKYLKDLVAEYKAKFLKDDLWISHLYDSWGHSDYDIPKVQRVAMKKVITQKTGKLLPKNRY